MSFCGSWGSYDFRVVVVAGSPWAIFFINVSVGVCHGNYLCGVCKVVFYVVFLLGICFLVCCIAFLVW